MDQSTETDHSGRIVAIRVNGTVVKSATSPASPDFVEGEDTTITYDAISMDGLVSVTNTTPSGRISRNGFIQSARIMDKCELCICGAQARLYVRETLIIEPCLEGVL